MKRIISLIIIAIMAIGIATADSKKPTVKKDTTEQVTTTKKEPVLTSHTYKGMPVYQGAKGGYFVKRVSKKTGNEYRQYIKPDKFDTK